MSENELIERCPACGEAVTGAAVGVGENMDGSTFIYCACGYVLDGMDEDRVLHGDRSKPSPLRGVIDT